MCGAFAKSRGTRGGCVFAIMASKSGQSSPSILVQRLSVGPEFPSSARFRGLLHRVFEEFMDFVVDRLRETLVLSRAERC
jgi:hypothetical protein